MRGNLSGSRNNVFSRKSLFLKQFFTGKGLFKGTAPMEAPAVIVINKSDSRPLRGRPILLSLL